MADEAGDDESGNALVNGSTLPPGRGHRGLAMLARLHHTPTRPASNARRPPAAWHAHDGDEAWLKAR